MKSNLRERNPFEQRFHFKEILFQFKLNILTYKVINVLCLGMDMVQV